MGEQQMGKDEGGRKSPFAHLQDPVPGVVAPPESFDLKSIGGGEGLSAPGERGTSAEKLLASEAAQRRFIYTFFLKGWVTEDGEPDMDYIQDALGELTKLHVPVHPSQVSAEKLAQYTEVVAARGKTKAQVQAEMGQISPNTEGLASRLTDRMKMRKGGGREL